MTHTCPKQTAITHAKSWSMRGAYVDTPLLPNPTSVVDEPANRKFAWYITATVHFPRDCKR